MKRGVLILAQWVTVPLTLVVVVPAQAAINISSCPVTITAPGSYVLAKDLSCSGTAITITASNVDLHLGGHTLSGSSVEDGEAERRHGDCRLGGQRPHRDGLHLNPKRLRHRGARCRR